MIIDYTGSAARYLDPESRPSPTPTTRTTASTAALEPIGLVALDYSPAEDHNALVALEDLGRGERRHDDLRPGQRRGRRDARARSRTAGSGPTACSATQNPVYYGLTFKDFVALEYGPPLTEALEAGRDPGRAVPDRPRREIATGNFVVLEDDKGLLSADNIVPVLRSEIADAYGDALADAINELSALLTTEDLIAWNVATDIDKDEPADVAAGLAGGEEPGLTQTVARPTPRDGLGAAEVGAQGLDDRRSNRRAGGASRGRPRSCGASPWPSR